LNLKKDQSPAPVPQWKTQGWSSHIPEATGFRTKEPRWLKARQPLSLPCSFLACEEDLAARASFGSRELSRTLRGGGARAPLQLRAEGMSWKHAARTSAAPAFQGVDSHLSVD